MYCRFPLLLVMIPDDSLSVVIRSTQINNIFIVHVAGDGNVINYPIVIES